MVTKPPGRTLLVESLKHRLAKSETLGPENQTGRSTTPYSMYNNGRVARMEIPLSRQILPLSLTEFGRRPSGIKARLVHPSRADNDLAAGTDDEFTERTYRT